MQNFTCTMEKLKAGLQYDSKYRIPNTGSISFYPSASMMGGSTEWRGVFPLLRLYRSQGFSPSHDND